MLKIKFKSDKLTFVMRFSTIQAKFSVIDVPVDSSFTKRKMKASLEEEKTPRKCRYKSFLFQKEHNSSYSFFWKFSWSIVDSIEMGSALPNYGVQVFIQIQTVTNCTVETAFKIHWNASFRPTSWVLIIKGECYLCNIWR